MSFVTYDLTFLIVFTLLVVLFLYIKRAKLGREGIMYLYRTQVAVKLMDRFAKKNKKFLKFLEYPIIIVGYLLMATIVVLVVGTIYTYFKIPASSEISQVPAVLPLLPYFTSFFGLDSFFPPFYFTYFILAILIVMFVHEFSHGIFMRLNKLRIKSTGFAFLGPILGAFVEQDDKAMVKMKSFPQKAILAAGVFANVLTAVIFGLLLFGFFNVAFAPSGVNALNTYPTKIVNLTDISFYSSLENVSGNLINVSINGIEYFTVPEAILYSLSNNLSQTVVFDNSPSFKARLFGEPIFNVGVSGAITSLNGIKITSHKELQDFLAEKNPGDEVNVTIIKADENIISPIKAIYAGKEENHTITLGDNNGNAFLGVVLVPPQSTTGITRKITSYMLYTPVKDLSIYHESKSGDFSIFIFYLLWWIVTINTLVAVFNMIPAGIFDGGRFFYLTVAELTRSEKKAQKAMKWSANILWFALILLIVKWIWNITLAKL